MTTPAVSSAPRSHADPRHSVRLSNRHSDERGAPVELSSGARHLLAKRSDGTPAISESKGQEATKLEPLPKRDEGSAFLEAANWFYESVLTAFASAAARQLDEIGQAAWEGLSEVTVKAAEFVVNASLLVVGAGISAVQTLLGLEQPGRQLDASERTFLGGVFGPGLDLDKVRIKSGFAGIASLSDRPFAFGNTIYMKDQGRPYESPAPGEYRAYEARLLHEAVHVWQHQHGNTPMAESIWEDRIVGNAYDWEAGFREGRSFHELNVEQQAAFLEAAAHSGYFQTQRASFVRDGVDYTCHLEQALRQLRRP